MGTKTKKLLTEVELEMMRVLWARKEATVNDVLDALAPQRKLAYTSVSTMLRILEQKGAVGSRKEGRGHVYYPKLEKTVYETKSLRHLVDNVFGGAPVQLVQRLLEVESLSDEELTAIKKLLKDKQL
jgi:predicted transcriptional regulator